jgi:Methyltransferase domain
MKELLTTSPWQMTLGERAALEGVLSQTTPSLSIEIGTAEGGSLRRIAAHSTHVHSFDLVTPAEAILDLPGVTLHTGDSHVLLDEFLKELERDHVNVDFALVDGDHAAEGVRRDMETLLSSPAVGRCVILIHDTANEIVREGLERVDYARHPKIMRRDLDFVAGHLSEHGAFANQLWGGLGLVMVDDHHAPVPDDVSAASEFYPSFALLSLARERLLDTDADSHELRRTREALHSVTSSASWRLTEPLRAVKRAVNRRRFGR